MSYTLQELIDVSTEQARVGLDPSLSFDAEMTAESLLPTVFRQVGREAARDENTRSILKRAKTVSFTNGTATLDDDVLTEYKTDSTLYDPDDLTKEYALVSEWHDFVRSNDDRLGYYCIKAGTTIAVIEPGDAYDPTSGISDSRQLVIPCTPLIPATANGVIDVPEEVADSLIEKLGLALRGQLERSEAA